MLRFPKTKANNENKYLYELSQLEVMEPQFKRKVHLFEHLILIAHGMCLKGFIKMITYSENVPNSPENPSFSAYMTFTSISQGDLHRFSKYSKGFIEQMNKNSIIKQEHAIKAIQLAKGINSLDEIEDISEFKLIYKSLFSTMNSTGSGSTGSSNKAMNVHKLATLSDYEIEHLLPLKSQIGVTNASSEIESDFNKKVKPLIFDTLDFDMDSYEWLCALMKLSLKDTSGFEYIAKEYDISNSKANIYKSMFSDRIQEMHHFFTAINDEVPHKLCKYICEILNGDVKTLSTIICGRISLKQAPKSSKMTIRKLYESKMTEKIDEIKKNLTKYLEMNMDLIEKDIMDQSQLGKVFKKAGFSKEVAKVLISFNSVINHDMQNVYQILECKQFKDEIDQSSNEKKVIKFMFKKGEKAAIDNSAYSNIDVFKSIVKIGTNSYENQDLVHVLDRVITTEQLFESEDTGEKLKGFQKSSEFRVIKNIIKATKGELESLGHLCDQLMFNNKSSVCTLLTSLIQGKFNYENMCSSEENKILIRKRLFIDFRRILEKLFSQLGIGEDSRKVIGFMEKFEVVPFLLILFVGDITKLDEFLPNVDEVGDTIEEEILTFLLKFIWSPNEPPEMTKIFQVASKVILKSFERQEKDTNGINPEDEKFLHEVKHFEYNMKVQDKNLKKMSEKLRFNGKVETLFAEGTYETLQKTYDYEVTDSGITFSLPKIFSLLFQAGNGELVAIQQIAQMMIPLFKNIPSAIKIMNIVKNMKQGNFSSIYESIPDIVEIMTFAYLVLSENDSQVGGRINKKALEKMAEMIKPVSMWVKGITGLIIQKDDFKVKDYADIFNQMIEEITKYYKELDEPIPIPGLEKLMDVMLAIQGICKGNLEYIEPLAKSLG